jgi:hypothetical protein
MNIEKFQKKEDFLVEFANNKIKKLEEKDISTSIINIFKVQIESVIDIAMDMPINEGEIVFLPVIPINRISLIEQLSRFVKNNDLSGYVDSGLEPMKFFDLSKIPLEPYWIFGVDNGKSTLGNSFVREEVEKVELFRKFLTLTEIFSLCANSDVLSKYGIEIYGSCYKTSDNVPVLGVDFNGRPKLCKTAAMHSSIKWGAPSCAFRFCALDQKKF